MEPSIYDRINIPRVFETAADRIHTDAKYCAENHPQFQDNDVAGALYTALEESAKISKIVVENQAAIKNGSFVDTITAQKVDVLDADLDAIIKCVKTRFHIQSIETDSCIFPHGLNNMDISHGLRTLVSFRTQTLVIFRSQLENRGDNEANVGTEAQQSPRNQNLPR